MNDASWNPLIAERTPDRPACRDVALRLESWAPPALAERWDNSGWMCGEPDRPVTGILVCLDATPDRVAEAAQAGENLIVSHHPPLFAPLRSVTDDTREGRLVGMCWRNGIQIYSAHTNFDAACGGLADLLACELGLVAPVPFPGPSCEGLEGRARQGRLPEQVDAPGFIRWLSQRLGASGPRIIGRLPDRIERIVTQNGAYDEALLPHLRRCPPDVLVAGDVKYHDALDLAEAGIAVADCGHFHTERMFVPAVVRWLSARFPEVPVRAAVEQDVYADARLYTEPGNGYHG